MSKQCICYECERPVELVKPKEKVESVYYYKDKARKNLRVVVKPLVPNSLDLCWYHRRIWFYVQGDKEGITPLFRHTLSKVRRAVRIKL